MRAVHSPYLFLFIICGLGSNLTRDVYCKAPEGQYILSSEMLSVSASDINFYNGCLETDKTGWHL